MHARVDGEQEADEDLVRKHQRGLRHVEAVPGERRRRHGPARGTGGVRSAAAVPAGRARRVPPADRRRAVTGHPAQLFAECVWLGLDYFRSHVRKVMGPMLCQ